MDENIEPSESFQGVKMTPEALRQANELNKTDQNRGMSLRLYLEGKGCDGFFYGVAFDNVDPNDIHFPQGDIDLIVDPDAIEFVDGAKIEWVDDERGSGFLVDNPNHKKFRGKFYKRSAWQDKLNTKLALKGKK